MYLNKEDKIYREATTDEVKRYNNWQATHSHNSKSIYPQNTIPCPYYEKKDFIKRINPYLSMYKYELLVGCIVYHNYEDAILNNQGQLLGQYSDKIVQDIIIKNINPETTTPDGGFCNIGYSPQDKKWYGWNIIDKRPLKGFGIGDCLKKGDCIAKTLDDCKQMAINYANAIIEEKPSNISKNQNS